MTLVNCQTTEYKFGVPTGGVPLCKRALLGKTVNSLTIDDVKNIQFLNITSIYL